MRHLLTLVAIILPTIIMAQSTFPVYSDGFVNGAPSGKMGAKNGSGLQIDPNSQEKPFSGETCLKIGVDSTESWSGIFVQSSGTWRKAGEQYTDLSGYKYLIVHARSDKNYTLATMGMGEGDEAATSEKNVQLTSEWKRFVFEIAGKKKSVNGLFLMVFANPGNVYFDNIYYADSTFKPESTDQYYAAPLPPMSPDAFYIYSDKMEHGIPSGYSGEKNGISMKFNPESKESPFYGSRCLQIDVDNSEAWRALYIFASGSWNDAVTEKTKLPDLSEYDKLVFYARSKEKHQVIREIGFGGQGGDTDQDARSEVFLELSPQWQKFEISLKNLSRTRVNTLLFLVLDEGTIYFDEVKFVKSGEKAQ